MIENINKTISFIKKDNNPEWPCFLWEISINDHVFEYRTGLGHATPMFKGNGYTRNLKPKDKKIKVYSELKLYLHIPSIEDILYCLFSDANCAEDLFQDFCDNLGYSSDSIKAKEVYDSCQSNTIKLRKALGRDYYKIKDYIESLEL